ncbi:MAG: MFS transporter, partial [Desulfofundulus sp.]
FKLKGEWRDARGEKFDPAGAVLYSLSMAALMSGIAAANTTTLARWVLVAGIVLLALFIRKELRYPFPLININLFRNLVFAFSNLAALIHYSATFAVGFLLSLYLQVVRGLDAQTAGFILLAQPVLMAILSPLSGRLSDRVEPRLLASLGMALSFAGLTLFTLINKTTPIWAVMVNLVLLGTGFALFSSPNTNAVMGSVEKRYYGVASATLGTMRLVGQALSMALVTLFFGFYMKGKAVTSATSPLLLKSMHVSFLLFAVLCACGVFFSLARGEVRGKQEHPAR